MHYSKWKKTTVKVENMVATLHIWKLHIFLGIGYKHTYYEIKRKYLMYYAAVSLRKRSYRTYRLRPLIFLYCNWIKLGRRANDHRDKDAKFDTWWNFKVLNHWMRLRGKLFLILKKKCNRHIARYKAKYLINEEWLEDIHSLTNIFGTSIS